MELKIIKFETAVLAKKLGFDLIIKTDYLKIGLEPPMSRPWNEVLRNWNSFTDHYSAPTQDLLRDWLREVHNIHCTAVPTFQYGDIVKWFPYTQSLSDGTCKNKTFENPTDDFYEAYEASILVGLNLIKNKNL